MKLMEKKLSIGGVRVACDDVKNMLDVAMTKPVTMT
jgi:hypothetical protein